MPLVILAVTCLAALALSLATYSASASVLLAVIVYAVSGTLLLFAVLFVALLREQAELSKVSDPLLFPAE